MLSYYTDISTLSLILHILNQIPFVNVAIIVAVVNAVISCMNAHKCPAPRPPISSTGPSRALWFHGDTTVDPSVYKLFFLSCFLSKILTPP